MVVEQRIVHHSAVRHGKAEISDVDGKPETLYQMHARLAATQFGIISDVIVDERSRVEMLDSRSRRRRLLDIATDCPARRKADERTLALAAVLAVIPQRLIQVAIHIGMRPMRNIGVDQVADPLGIAGKVFLERRRFDIRLGKYFSDGRHAVLSSIQSVGRSGGIRTLTPCGGGF